MVVVGVYVGWCVCGGSVRWGLVVARVGVCKVGVWGGYVWCLDCEMVGVSRRGVEGCV